LPFVLLLKFPVLLLILSLSYPHLSSYSSPIEGNDKVRVIHIEEIPEDVYARKQ
jgi:hypothetical protein